MCTAYHAFARPSPGCRTPLGSSPSPLSRSTQSSGPSTPHRGGTPSLHRLGTLEVSSRHDSRGSASVRPPVGHRRSSLQQIWVQTQDSVGLLPSVCLRAQALVLCMNIAHLERWINALASLVDPSRSPVELQENLPPLLLRCLLEAEVVASQALQQLRTFVAQTSFRYDDC